MGTEGLLLWTPLLKTKTPSTPDKAKAVPAKSARGHQHISLKSAHSDSTSEPSKHFFCLSLFQCSVYPLSLKQSQILGSLLFPAILAEVLLSPILVLPLPLSPFWLNLLLSRGVHHGEEGERNRKDSVHTA